MFAARLPHPGLAPRPQQSLLLPTASVPKGIAPHGDTVGAAVQPEAPPAPATTGSAASDLEEGQAGAGRGEERAEVPSGPLCMGRDGRRLCRSRVAPAETLGPLHPRTAHSQVEDVPCSSRSQCGFTAEPPTQAATALLAQPHGQHSLLPTSRPQSPPGARPSSSPANIPQNCSQTRPWTEPQNEAHMTLHI